MAISNIEQLHRHVLANSKRGIAVDEDGKLDDEISVISFEVSNQVQGMCGLSSPILANSQALRRTIRLQQKASCQPRMTCRVRNADAVLSPCAF